MRKFIIAPFLVLSLMVMGLSTFAIGLVPAYATIGIWAPVLVILASLVLICGAAVTYLLLR